MILYVQLELNKAPCHRRAFCKHRRGDNKTDAATFAKEHFFMNIAGDVPTAFRSSTNGHKALHIRKDNKDGHIQKCILPSVCQKLCRSYQ